MWLLFIGSLGDKPSLEFMFDPSSLGVSAKSPVGNRVNEATLERGRTLALIWEPFCYVSHCRIEFWL